MTTFVPELASAWNDGALDRFRARFGQGLRLVWTGVVPATVVLAVGAAPIVSGLLGRGAFGVDAQGGTADVLATMALGLPGFSAYLFALRGFYAIGDTRTPFLANVFENGLQVVLTLLLVPSASSPGVALGTAYTVAYTAAGVLALYLLHRRVGSVATRDLGATVVRLAVAAAAGAGTAAAARAGMPEDTAAIVEAVAVAVAGLVAFVAVGLAIGLAEIRQLAGAVTGRRRSE
jgi:putative peptidoglycan lipid II flippase